jgi:hypothetical protein
MQNTQPLVAVVVEWVLLLEGVGGGGNGAAGGGHCRPVEIDVVGLRRLVG